MKDLDRLLSSVAKELRNLGPIERSRAVAQIRQDVMDLAIDGKIDPPGTRDVSRAVRAMPDPGKLARAYLRTSQPSRLLIRIASVMNSLLGLAVMVLTGYILTFLMGAMWVHPVFLLGVILLFLSGLFVFVVYILAVLSPIRATRLRYVVLIPLTPCVIIVSWLVLWIPLQLAEYAIYGMALFVLVLLGGSYSVSYVHGQLPRLARGSHLPVTKRDYFLALESMLSDLDIVRREDIVEELEQHVESGGLDLTALSPLEAYSPLEDMLGPPEDVAEAYLRDAPKGLSKKQKGVLMTVLVPAMIGPFLGGAIIVWNMFSELPPMENPEYLTPLGLIGSMGLLCLSLVVVSYVARMYRAPAKVADYLFPAAVLSLVTALIISSTLAGIVSGGIVRQHDSYTYSTYAHVAEDGGLDILWTETLCGRDSPFVVCAHTGETKTYLTRLDADRRISSKERVPWGPVRGDVLDFDRVGDTWVVLLSDSLHSWGADNIGMGIDGPPGSDSVAGIIDGHNATVIKKVYAPSRDSVTISYRQFDWLDYEDETVWSVDFDLSGHDDRLAGALWNGDSLLLLREESEDNTNYTRSTLEGFLFDSGGTPISNTSIFEMNLTKYDPEDETDFWISQYEEGADSFWMSAMSTVTSNRTQRETSWLFQIDAHSGNITKWNIHEDLFPVPSDPREEGDLALFATQNMFLSETRVLVGSHWRYDVWKPGEGWQLDPSLGGRYVASVSTQGDLEYNVRLGDVAEFDGFIPPISAWGDIVSVLVPSFDMIGLDSDEPLTAFSLQGPVPMIESHEIDVDYEQSNLLLLYSLAGGNGIAIEPGISDFAGKSWSEDPGFLGWKYHMPVFWADPTENYVELPLLVRVDLKRLDVVSVPLASPKYPPDTVAGLLLTGVAASGLMATLHFGYRWAKTRGRKSFGKSERPSATE